MNSRLQRFNSAEVEISTAATQGMVSKEQLIQLAPRLAACVGVPVQDLEAALVTALNDMTAEEVDASEWATGLRLELGHHCRCVQMDPNSDSWLLSSQS